MVQFRHVSQRAEHAAPLPRLSWVRGHVLLAAMVFAGLCCPRTCNSSRSFLRPPSSHTAATSELADREALAVRRRQGLLAATAGCRLLSTSKAAEAAGWDAVTTALPEQAIDSIRRGEVATVQNWLPSALVTSLREDAVTLHDRGLFSGEGKGRLIRDADSGRQYISRESTSRDRQTLRRGIWSDDGSGSRRLRVQFEDRLQRVRQDVGRRLGRDIAQPLGQNTSYSRFGPGALMKRHFDEAHEDTKGVFGWTQPTRLSLSWLVYLNDDWDMQRDGGALRSFSRVAGQAADAGPIGEEDGYMQMGWLRTPGGLERPVYLDSRNYGQKCLLFADEAGRRRDLTRPFRLQGAPVPVPFERFMLDSDDASRFRPFSFPVPGDDAYRPPPASEEVAVEHPPTGGSLVIFDSVATPHEVLETYDRERWAAFGWFSQPLREPV
eukprot:TRINITY_DN80415_c0_g1_i1.p1 TRINITY_DN80415_c0_g1~~TRINITY_DN80415_c0_g1_i1.p1  ORF type:complete len:437 (+),score=64.13 TRINITY_DN80415_c0_g1_i1:86-1396(+)